jgi:hypothetical protein
MKITGWNSAGWIPKKASKQGVQRKNLNKGIICKNAWKTNILCLTETNCNNFGNQGCDEKIIDWELIAESKKNEENGHGKGSAIYFNTFDQSHPTKGMLNLERIFTKCKVGEETNKTWARYKMEDGSIIIGSSRIRTLCRKEDIL